MPPHLEHRQARTYNGLAPSFTPHRQHTWEVGENQPIRWNPRSYSRALYSSMITNAAQPASWMDLASRVRARPFTAKSSTAIAWFSRISLVDNCW
jgi:hypothetical protein